MDQDWHPNAVTAGPADSDRPPPPLRSPGFAGLDCFPFLLLSGFPPSPPLRKPQCPKEGSRPASTVWGPLSLSPLSLHPPLNLRVKDTKFKKIISIPLGQVLPLLLAFLYAVTFLEKVVLCIIPFPLLVTLLLDSNVLPGGELKLCTILCVNPRLSH